MCLRTKNHFLGCGHKTGGTLTGCPRRGSGHTHILFNMSKPIESLCPKCTEDGVDPGSLKIDPHTPTAQRRRASNDDCMYSPFSVGIPKSVEDLVDKKAITPPPRDPFRRYNIFGDKAHKNDKIKNDKNDNSKADKKYKKPATPPGFRTSPERPTSPSVIAVSTREQLRWRRAHAPERQSERIKKHGRRRWDKREVGPMSAPKKGRARKGGEKEEAGSQSSDSSSESSDSSSEGSDSGSESSDESSEMTEDEMDMENDM